MMDVTETTICVFNSGAIRLDDQLFGIITQYDILRCLPFIANLTKIRVNGATLSKALDRGLKNINTGMFISYAGLEYNATTTKWSLQSNRQLIDDPNLQLTLVTIPYFIDNTDLKYTSEILGKYITITRAFIEYLERTYTKAIHHKPS
jgi:2',3'-cyclic-nucleotide 2'-phosphodiesterase (5'-nucleotidase family)